MRQLTKQETLELMSRLRDERKNKPFLEKLKPIPFQIRCWVIKKLIGDMVVIANHKIHGGLELEPDKEMLIFGCGFFPQ